MSELPSVPARRDPVTTTYHGVEVTEDYRWLEDAASPETRAWTRAQDDRARRWLESRAAYPTVRGLVEELLRSASTSYGEPAAGGGLFFALKRQPPAPQPFLVVSQDPASRDSEHVLLDPVALDPKGTTAIDWYEPSPDGRLVAVSLSENGTEAGDVHMYDVATAAPTGEVVPRVNGGTAGGSLAWRADSSGFWYTRYPAPGEREATDAGFYQQVWHHRLGDRVEDDVRDLTLVTADDRIAEHVLLASADGRWVVDTVQRGDGGEFEVLARGQGEGGTWWRLADLPDRCTRVASGGDNLFLLTTRDAAHGMVLRLRLAEGATLADAAVVVPESTLDIEDLTATASRLWLLDMDGGPNRLRCTDHDGAPLPAPSLPPVSAVTTLVALGRATACWSAQSWVTPPRWFTFADDAAEPAGTAWDTDYPLDLGELEVERVHVTAHDGVQVPLTVVRPAGTRGRPAPLVLTGYGGYGISLKPWFVPGQLAWLRLGGVIAVANIRGGGEYGEAWHHAGRLTSKQTCFDDFTACAAHLVDTGVTTRDQLAIRGGSNGGLLMGALTTQHPDVARAVVAQVPVLDALRVELHPNGAFNITEFGTVTDPDEFAALHAYSPVHHVQEGTAYPAVLLTAGEHDPRVDAYHAKKMAALLQAATSSGEPVLLVVEDGGHGIGSSLDQQIETLTQVLTFTADRLGVGQGRAS